VLVLYVLVIGGDISLRRWQTVTYTSLQLEFTAYFRN
jgi:hypothetical protein